MGISLLTPSIQACPQPLEQHSCPLGQSLLLEHSSTQIPAVLDASVGHTRFDGPGAGKGQNNNRKYPGKDNRQISSGKGDHER